VRSIVITGPTASGKTALALALAGLADVEIVSADSRQVYRRLDIGTAKPDAAARAAAPHHGIDLVGVTERYSAGRFARDAAGWLGAIEGRGRLAVVVGGTGFYIRALFEGLFEEPDLGPARLTFRERLDRLSAAELGRWARRLDPAFAGGGRQRASRAVEIALLTGRTLTALRAARPARPSADDPFYVRLVVPRDLLARRIETRAGAMLAAGLVDEVRALLAAHVPADAPGFSAVGYREVIEVLDGRREAGSLAGAIAQATRRYAKRQDTWFRHQLPEGVLVLDATAAPDTLAREVLSGYRAARK